MIPAEPSSMGRRVIDNGCRIGQTFAGLASRGGVVENESAARHTLPDDRHQQMAHQRDPVDIRTLAKSGHGFRQVDRQ